MSRLVWMAVAGYLTALVLTVWPGYWPFAALALLLLCWRRALPALIAASIVLTALAVAANAPARSALTEQQGSHEFSVQLTSAANPLSSRFGVTAETNRARAEARVEAVDGAAVHANVILIGELGQSAWGDRLTVTGRVVMSGPWEPLETLVLVEHTTSREAVGGLLGLTEGLRASFRSAAERLPGVAGELVPGLAIGDTSGVSTELAAAMRASSLTHLMAVSGANCALVVAVLWGGLAAFGAARPVRVGAAALGLAGFVLLVTPQPSVIRAAVMAVIALIALLRGSVRTGLTTLAAAVLILLLLDPWLAWNAGFALSVAATAGLLVLSGPITTRLQPRLGQLAPAVAIPLAAQLACTPILVLLSPNIPLWGVPANILAGWFAPAATMLGVIACLLLPLVPWLGMLVLWSAGIPAAIVGHIALAVERLPGAQLPWPAGVFGMLLAALMTVVMLALFRPKFQRAARLVLACAALGSVGIWWLAPAIRTVGRPADWVIAGCDVGQGDAFLIRSGNAIGLIDTGPDPAKLGSCLDELQIDRINLLILTHYDRDHVAGTPAIIGRVDEAIVGPVGDSSDLVLRGELQRGGANVHEVGRGDRGTFGSTNYLVLWPNGSTEPGNPSSVSIAITLDGVDVVFLGDLGEDAQNALLRTGVPGGVDVVKVAHHGSADQSAELYTRLAARIGLIGVGPNDYGHPTASLLDLLEQQHTQAVRTDTAGLILLAPAAENTLRLWTARAPPS